MLTVNGTDTVDGMARPRKKSDPIQFRLPIPVYDHLVKKAGDRTPAKYLVDMVTADFDKNGPKPEPDPQVGAG